jgi:hypothetical protein
MVKMVQSTPGIYAMASDLKLTSLFLLLTLLTTTTCSQQQLLQQQTYSCEQTAAGGLLPPSWDDGNCRRGAASSVWKRDPHTNVPTGGDEALCDASEPPGKLTCEARLSTWNSKHVLLAPPPNSDKERSSIRMEEDTQTLVVVSSIFHPLLSNMFHHFGHLI